MESLRTVESNSVFSVPAVEIRKRSVDHGEAWIGMPGIRIKNQSDFRNAGLPEKAEFLKQ